MSGRCRSAWTGAIGRSSTLSEKAVFGHLDKEGFQWLAGLVSFLGALLRLDERPVPLGLDWR